MLDDDGLDLRAAEGFHRLEAVVPAGGPAWVVHPDHVDLGAALFLGNRVVVSLELVLKFAEEDSATHAARGRVEDGLTHLGLRDDLL